MREKLQTLPLTELKELAKSQGIKGCSSMRKAELIDVLCSKYKEEEKKEETQEEKGGDFAEERIEKRSEVKESKGRQEERAGTVKEEGVHGTGYSQQGRRGGQMQRKFDSARPYRQNSELSRQDNQKSDAQRPENQREHSQRQDSGRMDPVRQEGQKQDNLKGEYQNRDLERIDVPRQDGVRGEFQRTDSLRAETPKAEFQPSPELQELDSGIDACGILEVMQDGFGFIRCENYLPGENDVYVAPSQIRRFNLKTGDIILGSRRVKTAAEKFAALLYVKTINGYPASEAEHRPNFENMTPVFPNERLHMETYGSNSTAMRVLDLLAPIGKGQRGMIVSPPKAGKTTLLKQVAQAITRNHPEMHLIILLIDERPEEVTDMKESIVGKNVEVLYSTFDELPDRHKRVSEMVIERAKRLVEHGRDVIILLDSITRLARAYNLTVSPSGRTLSGGLDPAALHMPKRFFGAARNMREGGSLTILATALVDTGSRMDDVIYEEFKGTGNMELVLDRKLSEKRIFPAIDILKSGTRRDDLLLTKEEAEAVDVIHKMINSSKPEDSVEKIIDVFARTRTNGELVEGIKNGRYLESRFRF